MTRIYWPHLAGNDEVTTSSYCDIMFLSFFYNTYKNQTWEKERPTCADLILQEIVMTLPLVQVMRIHGFIFIF